MNYSHAPTPDCRGRLLLSLHPEIECRGCKSCRCEECGIQTESLERGICQHCADAERWADVEVAS